MVALLPEMAVSQFGGVILESPNRIAKYLQRRGKPRQQRTVEMHVIRHHHMAEKEDAGIQPRNRLKRFLHLLPQR